LIIISIIVGAAALVLSFKPFFGDFSGFLECLKFWIDHIIVLDSVPVGVRLKLRSVANALARKLVIKVGSLPEVYTAKARFSSEKSGQNIVYWICE
jgi:hypothetical protein